MWLFLENISSVAFPLRPGWELDSEHLKVTAAVQSPAFS